MGLGLWFSHVATDIDLMWQHVSELMHLVSYRFTNQFTCCTICEFHTVTEYCSGALVRILKSGIATEHTLELLSMCAQHECRDLRRRYNYIPASEAVRASAQLLGVCPRPPAIGALPCSHAVITCLRISD